MTDVAQILLLPPPVRPGDHALTTQRRDEVAATADATSQEQSRARRFRFRVYEGGGAAEAGTQYDTRRTAASAQLAASNAGGGNTAALDGGGDSNQATGFVFRRNSGSGASSAFLAQSIAQEQLGEGLHNPPHAAASAAYTRTGASLTPPPSLGLNVSA